MGLLFQRKQFRAGVMIVQDRVKQISMVASEVKDEKGEPIMKELVELVEKGVVLKPGDLGKVIEFADEDYVLAGRLGAFFKKA